MSILYFFGLHWVFVVAHGLSLAAASGGYSRVVVHGLLIAVASLVAEHELQGLPGLQELWLGGSVVAVPRL